MQFCPHNIHFWPRSSKKPVSTSLRRQYFRRLRQTISASLSPEQSGDDTSPAQSPVSVASSLSPVTPSPRDTLGLLRPDSPTRGLGMFHKVSSLLDTLFSAVYTQSGLSVLKGRSSSIATTTEAGGEHSGMKIKDSSRRFSVDSVPRHRRMLRIFRKVHTVFISSFIYSYN